VFLVAALHHPSGWGRYVYAFLSFLFAGGGVGIAGWHWRLQNLPPSEVIRITALSCWKVACARRWCSGIPTHRSAPHEVRFAI